MNARRFVRWLVFTVVASGAAIMWHNYNQVEVAVLDRQIDCRHSFADPEVWVCEGLVSFALDDAPLKVVAAYESSEGGKDREGVRAAAERATPALGETITVSRRRIQLSFVNAGLM